MSKTHEAVVGAQFGARASAYLTSAVHAAGADLDALAALVRDRPGARVLDLGSGGGHVSFAAAPHVGEVVACDLSPRCWRSSRGPPPSAAGNVTTREGVAESLPFADASFDFVLSRYSAHHWRDLDAGLREVARVLKPDGIAGIVDSVSPGPARLDTFLQAIELLRDPSHVRSRPRAEWEAALAGAGLSVQGARGFRVRDRVRHLDRADGDAEGAGGCDPRAGRPRCPKACGPISTSGRTAASTSMLLCLRLLLGEGALP